ncbi:uncharacterized protein isoform X2 [Leptinotarsa decemlineata]|uniref:uncharacterized protein isoform X2 n=1 Tax=Leptinotarsa decemlineata TaxID=7539 RepID=UPI003D30420A
MSSTSKKNIFTVENILGKRIRKGSYEYLIQWKGFSKKFNTWEPQKNILDKDLIEKFCNAKKNKATPKPITNEDSQSFTSTESEPFSDDDDICDPNYIPTSEEKPLDSSSCMNDFSENEEKRDTSSDLSVKKKLNSFASTESESFIVNDGALDPDYISSKDKPEELIETSDSDTNIRLVTNEFTGNNQEREVVSCDFAVRIDIPEVRKNTRGMNSIVQQVTTKKKKNFCLFCKDSYSQLPRHLETQHAEEKEVKLFANLPKNCPERKNIIAVIRKKGNFQHNEDFTYNTGSIITTRRTRKENVNHEEYVPCAKCLGYYSKVSIRKHFRKCSDGDQIKNSSNQRNVLVLGRKIRSDISPKANSIVRNNIFPILRQDNITSPLRYDDLVITYANKLTVKFPKPHHHPMIRSKIRLIGRILHEVKMIDSSVQDFSSLFTPKQYDNIIKAIQVISKLNDTSQHYGAPSTASTAGTLLKKCANVFVTELIKEENFVKKETVDNFVKLLEVDFGITVNKTVTESKLKNKRLKKVVLPLMSDIKQLNLFLMRGRAKYFQLLNEKFDIFHFNELQKYTLTSLQVFNRRRAGEVQRIELDDLNNMQSSQDLDQDIPSSQKINAGGKGYSRFTLRGKLGREVSVLLDDELLKCIKLLISYREQAGLTKNPYLFGIPNTSTDCLDACTLLRNFSEQCGAKKPETLRGTTLRKHVATRSSVLDLDDTEVSDLANFMGHADKIHREHYRIPIATREISRMSRLLEMAQGASPMGTVMRRSWGDEEKNVIHKVFEENFNSGILPSLKQCEIARISYPALQSRSPSQIKVWINNQFVKRKKVSCGSSHKIKRTHWNVSEISVAQTFLKEYIDNDTLPSLATCREIIAQNEKLKERNPTQLKLWVHNQIKKKKKNQL